MATRILHNTYEADQRRGRPSDTGVCGTGCGAGAFSFIVKGNIVDGFLEDMMDE